MREEKTRTRQSGVSAMALLMFLMFSLVVFSGLSQAQTHPGHTAEFTLSNLTVESSGKFSLAGQLKPYYPLSVAGYEISVTRNSGENAESIHLSSRNGLEEKQKGQSEIVLSKPPLNQGKVFGELIAGTALGMAIGMGAAYIGASITYDGTWFSDLPGALIGIMLAYPLGSALGVYLVGNIGSTTGSFSSALGAAYGGLILGAAGAYALNRVSQSASVIAFLAVPPLLATFSFNRSRRYKNPPMASVSLLNFRDGKMNLGIPTIMAFPSAPGSHKMDWLLNLASIEF